MKNGVPIAQLSNDQISDIIQYLGVDDFKALPEPGIEIGRDVHVGGRRSGPLHFTFTFTLLIMS